MASICKIIAFLLFVAFYRDTLQALGLDTLGLLQAENKNTTASSIPNETGKPTPKIESRENCRHGGNCDPTTTAPPPPAPPPGLPPYVIPLVPPVLPVESGSISGKPSSKDFPVDCSDVLIDRNAANGIYTIWPNGKLKVQFNVYCDMKTDGGGWTLLQRRADANGNPADYFSRDWAAYKNGFGNLLKEFWLGNDNIYSLTNQSTYELLVGMWDNNDTYASAKYPTFYIGDETTNYTLHVTGYQNGTAGDALAYHNGMMFSTVDRDNDGWSDGSCAQKYNGAWWYNNCFDSNLNGKNLQGPYPANATNNGIVWFEWKGDHYSLSYVEMKIRRRGQRLVKS